MACSHTLRGAKHIWLLFDVDKLPGAPPEKKKQISRRRTFHRRRQTAKNLFRWERLKGDGYELLLLHVRE